MGWYFSADRSTFENETYHQKEISKQKEKEKTHCNTSTTATEHAYIGKLLLRMCTRQRNCVRALALSSPPETLHPPEKNNFVEDRAN